MLGNVLRIVVRALPVTRERSHESEAEAQLVQNHPSNVKA